MFNRFLSTILLVFLLYHCTTCQLPPSEDDYIKAFLNITMQNYTSWTGNAPLPSMPEVVELQALNEDGVDINVEITNHSMSGYFDTASDSYIGRSIFRSKTLGVTRRVINEPFTFSGDYTANGLLKVSETLNVSFNGQGSWTLKTVNSSENLVYVGYKIVGENFINLLQSNLTTWVFTADWQPLELTGIVFEYNGEEDPSWRQKIAQAWVKLYENFLDRIDEPPNNQAPPRKLLHTFLVQKVTTTNLTDIIPGWGLSTSTPTPPTTPPSKGSNAVISVLLSLGLPVVASLAILITK